MPEAGDYNDGQVNVLSCMPDCAQSLRVDMLSP